MVDPRPGVTALFDAVADSYDQVGVEFFGPIAGELVAGLDPRPGERALDLGCGRGAALLPLAAAVGPTGVVVGGDLSPAMVERCRATVAGQGLSHVTVEVVDAQDPCATTVLGETSYDVVSASLVLFFLPDPGAALAAWRGLLGPGGRVGVSTFGPQDAVWASVDEVFHPYLPPALLDPRATGAESPFASDAGVEELLRAAGFESVRTTHRALDVDFADAEQWYRFTMSVGQRRFWSFVPEEERSAVRAEAERRLAAGARPDGTLRVGQDVRCTYGVRAD